MKIINSCIYTYMKFLVIVGVTRMHEKTSKIIEMHLSINISI